MAKKSKKILRQKKKIQYKAITEEEHILTGIRLSERCIDNSGSTIDEFFKGQVSRMKAKLETLRSKNELPKKLP